MKKYWILFKNSAMDQLRNPTIMFMRLLFLAVLVFATEKLWSIIGHKGFDPVNIVWYLVMNEVLWFGIDESMNKRIINDIRSGNIGYSLIRPMSYLTHQMAHGMGAFCARLPFLMIGGGLLAFFLTGGLPTTLYGLPIIISLMLFAGFFITMFRAIIGFLGLYVQSTRALDMVWNKGFMVLGGLFFPITVFPDWLYNIAQYTPFPYCMYHISRLIYEFSWATAFNTFAHLIGWLVVAFILSQWLYSKLLKKVSVNGG